MAKFVGYPRDRPSPERFFHNWTRIETTLFTGPTFWKTRAGRPHAIAKVCFRGFTWDENNERIPTGRIGVKIWATDEWALELREMFEGDRVVIEGAFTTADFQTDEGELKTTLTLMVGSIEKIDKVWDRSKDHFRQKKRFPKKA